MSKPTLNDIKSSLQDLVALIMFFDDKKLDDAERQKLSKSLAYVTAEIRGKYELKSDVYFTADCNALIETRRKYGDDFLT